MYVPGVTCLSPPAADNVIPRDESLGPRHKKWEEMVLREDARRGSGAYVQSVSAARRDSESLDVDDHDRMTSKPPALQRSKVPEIIVLFWVVKLLTTAMGEATSDYFVKIINPVVAVAIAGLILLGALVVQFRADRYVPWKYWFAVVMVAVSGTMAADVLHIQFGVPYAVTTPFFAVVLAAVFIAWHRVEGTLSIHSIRTPRREVFYWLTVMATFALGTALGDLTATTFHLGYLTSAVLFAALIAIPIIGFWRFRMNEVLAFWFAYVLTRPLGASIADWLSKPHNVGGLNLGDGQVALGFTVLIVGFVAYLTITHTDEEPA